MVTEYCRPLLYMWNLVFPGILSATAEPISAMRTRDRRRATIYFYLQLGLLSLQSGLRSNMPGFSHLQRAPLSEFRELLDIGATDDGTNRRIVLSAQDRGQAHHGCSIWIAEYDLAHILGDFRARTLALGAVRKANVKVSMIG